jgi:hypothetical protein
MQLLTLMQKNYEKLTLVAQDVKIEISFDNSYKARGQCYDHHFR